MTIDAEGRLVLCEHGNRVISRLEADGTRTTLVGEYEGRRLNGPNDATYASDGSLYFTDPGSGLEGRDESPLRELDFNGIYRLRPDGELELLVRDHPRPNGIALSPDESTLYVANSAADDIRWMAYDLGADGVSNRRVLYAIDDAQGAAGVADGMKVDLAGNVYATGPGGRLGDHVRRRAPRHHRDRRSDGQCGVGRRRADAVHDRFHRVVSGAADHGGGDSVIAGGNR